MLLFFIFGGRGGGASATLPCPRVLICRVYRPYPIFDLYILVNQKKICFHIKLVFISFISGPMSFKTV